MNDVKMNPIREFLLPLVERGDEFYRIIQSVRMIDNDLADELRECSRQAEERFVNANGDYAPRPCNFYSLCFNPIHLGDATFVSFQGESVPTELETGFYRVWQSPEHSGCEHWCFYDVTHQQLCEELGRQHWLWLLAVRDVLAGRTSPFTRYLLSGECLIVDSSAVLGAAAEPASVSVPGEGSPVSYPECACAEAEATSSCRSEECQL